MNILFWNTNIPKIPHKKSPNIVDCLLNLIIEKHLDLLVLSEYGGDIQELCSSANNRSKIHYVPIPREPECNRITGIINHKYETESLRGENQTHYQIIKILTPSYKMLVAAIHNISKLRASEQEQAHILRCFHDDIKKLEEIHQCENTVAIGDFNVNPFEISCIDADTMHSIPFREEVSNRPDRVVQGKTYKNFYNPTWKLFGNKCIPYATYYHNSRGRLSNYYWNAFDQVMIRQSLMPAFIEESLEIITKAGHHRLLKNGKPNAVNYSDHLPLFCILKEELI